ncbi:hypothetical protein ZWY2020_015016 [Hordeum vulgare]|nr:hypothetical protein ZWY2020_011146 [Hordeum vulgare]KAI5001244.1 hypothetical protein ZWY2020_015016 [Hordeum vulgare]
MAGPRVQPVLLRQILKQSTPKFCAPSRIVAAVPNRVPRSYAPRALSPEIPRLFLSSLSEILRLVLLWLLLRC